MSQNRKKLVDLFIGNLSNAVIHDILDKAINNKEVSERYKKEMLTSLDKAERYREKINPIDLPLLDKDIKYIRSKTANKVRSNLNSRIKNKYENINLDIIEKMIEKYLKITKVI